MSRLRATARIALSDPAAVVAPVCDHLVGHGATVTHEGESTTILLGTGRARLAVGPGQVLAEVGAPDLSALQEIRLAIASHIVEFAGAETPSIRWEGDGNEPAFPPDFREITVVSTEDVTPHMRRIRFRGERLERYDRLDALHVRLFLPWPGRAAPVWPVLGEDGLIRHAPEPQRPAVRKYTIREIDPATGTLAADFVLHEDAGPGSAFAARARPGDRIGMAGPGGRGLIQAQHYIFLADETGIPAIARILENLSRDAAGTAIIEVETADEEQELPAPPGVTVRWLHRCAKGGDVLGLQAAFRTIDLPKDRRTYCWVAAEHEVSRDIRAAARDALDPEKDRHLIVGYWRRGASS